MGEETISAMVSRMASIKPPGVLRRMMRRVAFSRLARAMALPTISVVTGWTTPSTFTAIAFGAAAAVCAENAAVNARITQPRNLPSLYNRHYTPGAGIGLCDGAGEF